MATATSIRAPAASNAPRVPRSRPSGSGGQRRPSSPGRTGTGSPLPSRIQSRLESTFGRPLDNVRVQQNADAARAQGARAFAYGPTIVLGGDASADDLPLMAHEVAHTIQQTGGAQPQTWTTSGGNAYEREAHEASQAAVQGTSFQVVGRTSTPTVQRLGLSDILDGLAELAANVPGFTLLTVIIGRNPINLRAVERNFTNLLRGFIGLIPGGELLFQILERYGVVARIGQWVSDQVGALGINFDYLRGRFTAFTDSLSWRDIFSPGDVWRRAKDIFTEPINRITNFISRLISQAITWLKETFMQPLSDFCRQVPGYGLVTVLLGRDPFTNVAVPRTAINVVRAFAEFIPGGTEKVNQLVESRALERAYQSFIAETQARNLTWARVTGTFTQAWNTLQLSDVLHPIDTLRRVGAIFRPLLGDLVSFAGAALLKLLEFIFEAAMGAGGARILAILKRARDTFQTIIRNPVGFLRNLLSAIGQGVRQFMTNILRHLRDGVIAWLTGPVARAGIQMPERWDLRGVIWFVLQILGLTWERIRGKLVNLLGERAVGMLEAGFQLFQEIREKGIVQALRDRVTEFFGQLRDAALGSIRTFIQERLVMAGITQLLSLLNPVGAIIQAIIKTYTTIQFFIQKINQILDLVESVVNSIAAIAAGAIGQAANFVEATMARTIPVILDFLARFIGLGDVGGQVQRTIRSLQQRVDQMLDRAVEWIRGMARNFASRALGGDPNAPPQQRLEQGMSEAETAVNRYAGRTVGKAILNPLLGAIRLRHRLTTLEVVEDGDQWAVEGTVNPKKKRGTRAKRSRPGLTRNSAFEIAWPKRPIANYQPIWLVPRATANGRLLSQTKLQSMPGAVRFTPTTVKQVFGEQDIGVTSNWQTFQGKVFSLAPHKGRSDSVKNAFNTLLENHGYDRSKTNDGTTDGDHVCELQMVGTGGDTYPNLWPLNSSENRSSGSTLKNTKVKISDTEEKAVHQLDEGKYYFKIKSFLH